jgi:hypothetical protein
LALQSEFFFFFKEKMDKVNIKILPSKIEVRMTTRDMNWQKRLIDQLIEIIPAENAMSYFLKTIEVIGTSQKTEVEKIVRCFLLVQNSHTTSAIRERWSMEEYVNFQLKAGQTTWQQIPVFLRYQNKRLGLIADPEFLIIKWSKNFENYDFHNAALIPSYPSDFNNNWLTLDEIQAVLEMWMYKKMFMEQQNKTRIWALNLLKQMAPVLYDFVYKPFGRIVLQTVYEMQNLIATDPDQGISTRLQLVKMYTPIFEQFTSKFATHVGFKFIAFKHPMFRPELIMTVFILERYVYQPYTDRKQMADFLLVAEYDLPGIELEKYTDTILLCFENMKPKSDKTFTRIDFDPKTLKDVIVPVHFQFFPKKNMCYSKIIAFQQVLYGHPIGMRLPDGKLNCIVRNGLFNADELKKLLNSI